ncbi:MAG: 3-isopropylmalate dehydrogenase [Halofilum sp. (in: g-proteobacteria)]
MSHRIALLPGDGVGVEIVAEAEKLLAALSERFGLAVECERADVGGAGVDAAGQALPDATLRLAREADAVLLGAVGGPKWDGEARERRPETGLLNLRRELELFANLRPAILYSELADASALKPELVAGLDLMIVRELTGDIYFGEPRGIETLPSGERRGYDTMAYSESEIERIARRGFEIAARRSGRLCSVDKANVLETSQLWREVVNRVHGDYPQVELSHMYVDNAAMQLVQAPRQFDVIVTGNMFGDILSDAAAMLTGSIGMLPSASLDTAGKGMYEPVHGSAPDIADKNIVNPMAMLLSTAMMLRYSLDQAELADRIERAVGKVLADGLRTADIAGGGRSISTSAMGDAVIAALE